MTILYTGDGRKVTVQHPIDVITAINSGNYFEKNPIQIKKVDPIAQKREDKVVKSEQVDRPKIRKTVFDVAESEHA